MSNQKNKDSYISNYIKKINESNDISSITPDNWMNNTKKGFSSWVNETFKNHSEQKDLDDILRPHQKLIKDYLQVGSPYRGLLLYHGLGTGKTRTSIKVCEQLLKNNFKENALIILPASLRTNFINELKQYGNFLYLLQNYNEFIKVKVDDVIEGKYNDQDLISGLFKDKFLKKMQKKGKNNLYIPVNNLNHKIPNLSVSKINNTNIKEIEDQINDLINIRYDFISSNGLSGKKIKKILMSKNDEDIVNNKFNNKIVIIDEVHNFIQGLHNDSTTMKFKLYEKLFKSKNSKFLLLSGTPIINDPIEISYTINLIRGPQYFYTTVIKKFPENSLFMKDKNFDIWESKSHNENFKLSFSISPNATYENDEDVIKDLKKYFDLIKTNRKEYEKHINYALPRNQEKFETLFINEDNTKSKNSFIFQKRIAGTISYFNHYDSEVYPERLSDEIHELDMSSLQFQSYIIQREKEIEKSQNERKRSKINKDILNTSKIVSSATYKIFSRALCNFAFPAEISRPYPKSMREFNEELDNGPSNEIEDIEEVNVVTLKSKEYKDTLNKALTALNNNKLKYLKGDALKEYSPKFYKIIKNLNRNGTAIIYSDFRKVEGLKTLGLSLEANNYSEMKVVKGKNKQYELLFDEKADGYFAKYGDADNKANLDNDIILDIFNNNIDKISKEHPKIYKQIINHFGKNMQSNVNNLEGKLLKILMITRSGAEGISLKNVRNVHILEPYWNQVRLNQVIGRANRSNSHMELPKEDRNFKVFYYIMKFTDKQSKNFKQEKLTVDQQVRDTALKKAELIDGFLQNLKEASIDCTLYSRLHSTDDLKCLLFDKSKSNENLYSFNIDEENVERVEKKSKNLDNVYTVRFKTINKIKNKLYIATMIDNTSYNIYDYDKFVRNNEYRKVGDMKHVNRKFNINIKIK